MNDLKSLINQCIEAMPTEPSEAREFALFYCPSSEAWNAAIGGRAWIMLGEFDGDFSADGTTPEEAVSALLRLIPAPPVSSVP